MLRFLLARPIAVIMVLIASLAISALAFFKLPVSLLPSIDVPEITISTQSPNSSPEEIEHNILRPIRETMLPLSGLKSVESLAQQERGTVTLRMQYGVDMDLAYIEANEKIDRIITSLPSSIDRPVVVKANASDIPIIRIQVVPKVEDSHVAVSNLTLTTLKRRLEQLEGVGLVDVNGVQRKVIRVSPDYEIMQNLGLSDADIIKTISDANLDLGSLYVSDGNYRFYLKLSSRLNDAADLKNLPVKIPLSLSTVKLYQICQIYAEPETPSGFHLFNRKKGLVITVHKQAEARMPEVMPEIYQVVEQFRKNYPTINFHLTQDQSQLLTLSIQNLSQSLAWGGLFAFAVLFVFMGGWREPVVMGIVLPISLMLSFSLLYVFNISLNIISLSGLALGLGMLVDNSIVVIDNIVNKRKIGQSLIDSCVDGTQEVMAPLISSALTNLAVFLPLIFMSGITGALFYDQAIAVSCILFVSIICTFVFVPLLYSLFNQNRMLSAKEDTRFFLWLKERYHRSFEIAWKNKEVTAIGMGLFIPLSIVLFLSLPKEGFPEIERNELVLTMDWNEPIAIDESLTRIQQFLTSFDSVVVSECDIGHQQFILKISNNSAQQAELYLHFASQRERKNAQSTIPDFFMARYPMAAIEMQNAPNAFEQLFISRTPLYEVRIRNSQSKNTMPVETAEALLRSDSLNFRAGKGFETESMVFIDLDFDKMKLYNVSFVRLSQKLRIIFGDYQITSLKNFGENIPIAFAGARGSAESLLRTTEVFSENGARYPIREFVKIQLQKSYKNITADASGTFQSLITNHIDDEKTTREHINSLLDGLQLTADFTGTWFEEQKNIEQIVFILFVSFLLMYFIITAEFESFTQPLIVMLSIPIGLAGSLMLLWMSGGSINVMSAIGLVVVLGILDNDAILKIDRINSLRKKMDLESAVFQAGLDRFKPIVLNTCTNVLALTPILFTSSLGGDLQRPVAITTIGGLIVATVAALYFVPIVYWSLHKRHSKT